MTTHTARGISFQVTERNEVVYTPTLEQFLRLIPILTHEQLCKKYGSKKIDTVLRNWFRVALTYTNSNISCNCKVENSSVYAFYLTFFKTEIRLWRNNGEYKITITIPPHRRGGYHDCIVRREIGLPYSRGVLPMKRKDK
jgi:hypothetical protein